MTDVMKLTLSNGNDLAVKATDIVSLTKDDDGYTIVTLQNPICVFGITQTTVAVADEYEKVWEWWRMIEAYHHANLVFPLAGKQNPKRQLIQLWSSKIMRVEENPENENECFITYELSQGVCEVITVGLGFATVVGMRNAIFMHGYGEDLGQRKGERIPGDYTE